MSADSHIVCRVFQHFRHILKTELFEHAYDTMMILFHAAYTVWTVECAIAIGLIVAGTLQVTVVTVIVTEREQSANSHVSLIILLHMMLYKVILNIWTWQHSVAAFYTEKLHIYAANMVYINLINRWHNVHLCSCRCMLHFVS